ncbi:MAG: D-alanyl-D-alanine carboxypeptidase/D-alanyl-D-alanine-endopeptidase [Opitutus sp.]|nr:D-alanyl-D-alanine carboxypeptidase/D-alanyl-D-alanine-endopeptidase [Opitutus sp.]
MNYPGRSRIAVALCSALLALGAAADLALAQPASAAKTVDELRARIEAQLAQPRFRGALWGVKIVSLESGQTLFEHHADRLMTPASNTKLYTSALALDQLGGDYRIVTPILATARPDTTGTVTGDVIVSGRGDPSWKSRGGSKDFWATFDPFVAALAKAGVRRVTGDLVADATWFHSLPNGSGWMVDDLNTEDGAEISALTLEANYVELRVTPSATVGQPCALEVLQPHTGLVLDNRTVTGATGTARRIRSQRIFGETVVHVFGELPVGDKMELLNLTVPRPAQWFATAVKEALARRGIRVDGTARSRRWPEATAVTATCVSLGEVSSPPLRDLLSALMKPSQNLETDLIFAHLGEILRPPAAPAWQSAEESATAALQKFLRQNGLPADEVRIEEGSGLSQYTLTTAQATVALLKFMATHRESAAFSNALPLAGVDGTLRRRLTGAPAEGNVRAKTGSLRWTKSLSGYVTSAAGERLSFSLMLNRDTAPPGRTGREELDDIAVLLAGLASRSVAP